MSTLREYHGRILYSSLLAFLLLSAQFAVCFTAHLGCTNGLTSFSRVGFLSVTVEDTGYAVSSWHYAERR